MNSGMTKILVGVILLVIALILAPVVVDQVDAVVALETLSDYPGAESIVKLVPLMYIVGVLFLAGFLSFRGVQSFRKKKRGYY